MNTNWTKREQKILDHLNSGRRYRLESSSTGISHYIIRKDDLSENYLIITHYEQFNPTDPGPGLLDESEALNLIQTHGYHLVKG